VDIDVSMLRGAELDRALKSFPSHIVKMREARAKTASKQSGGKGGINLDTPIQVDGLNYSSFRFVRQRLQEILNVAPNDTATVIKPDTADYRLVTGVLKYHPAYTTEKLPEGSEIKELKIDVKSTNNTKSKCFFIARSDDTVTDFSYIKCLDGLEKSLGQKKERAEETKPAESPEAASTEAASPEQAELEEVCENPVADAAAAVEGKGAEEETENSAATDEAAGPDAAAGEAQ